jgi:uncharacterized RDD family membrane protein YckC
MDTSELEYVGFWLRVWASVIDTVLLMLIVLPLALAIVGESYLSDERVIKGPVGFLLEWILPAAAVLAFWIARQATPGKMAIGARIVDAATGAKPTTGQCIGRYLAYYVSTIPLFLGFIWVAFDRRRQGWHDKLAGTVVVRPKRKPGPADVSFPSAPPADRPAGQ